MTNPSDTHKTLIVVAIMIVVIAFVLVAVNAADAAPSYKTKKSANDTTLPQTCYDDYFVNDSDGKKDQVFSVYTERCGIRVNGLVCAIVKTYEEGVGTDIEVVCPQGAR